MLNILHEAAHYRLSDIAEKLLNHGADVNAADTALCLTALHIAAEKGHSEIAEILLKLGADVNAEDDYGFTDLYMAEEKNIPVL